MPESVQIAAGAGGIITPMEWLLALLGGWLLTGAVRHYALQRQVLDMPCERSSHTVPTPRGGGLSFVLLLPLLLWLAGSSASWPLSVLLVLGSCTLALALVGWVDDHHPLSARLRFMAQAVFALLGLLWLPQLPGLSLPFAELPARVSWMFLPLWLLVLLWLTNLYNFMDGINGLAALQAVSVLLAAAGLLWWSGDVSFYPLLLLLCAPLLGFLWWNFPAARIFMGDVCSAPLGLMFGLLAFWLAAVSEVNLWCWLILLSVFVVDASWTLLVRLLSGQRWTEPHRSHAYQVLARRWGSHTPVSLLVALVNLVWLLPWAWLAMLWPQWGLLYWLLAAAPLGLLCYQLGAGQAEQ
ncbi:MAG: glycosyltransferase family 4 protein [Marinobacterium sp.]|nr:glycosyltransferase family 4 protein [Marinobacterium sp.]